MLLTLDRYKQTAHATFGRLSVDGCFECLTLEDVVRDLGPKGEGKVYGQTAIPAGRYQVVINESPRYGRPMMRLLNVPYFTGILIHKGNRSADTRGCILVGEAEAGDDLLIRSTAAYNRMRAKVEKALATGAEVWIEIRNVFPR